MTEWPLGKSIPELGQFTQSLRKEFLNTILARARNVLWMVGWNNRQFRTPQPHPPKIYWIHFLCIFLRGSRFTKFRGFWALFLYLPKKNRQTSKPNFVNFRGGGGVVGGPKSEERSWTGPSLCVHFAAWQQGDAITLSEVSTSLRWEVLRHLCWELVGPVVADPIAQDNDKTNNRQLSGTGDSQRDSRESIRANHSQLRPLFL